MIFNVVYGKGTADGNNIKYPNPNPDNVDKLYNELSINEIAVAIDSEMPLTVSEMPEAIRALHDWGIIATNLNVTDAEYTVIYERYPTFP